jgi:UDP-glucose 4-epimerase
MSTNVLVTGGAGFLGSHLVERLVAAGERTSVVDSLERGRRTWIHEGAQLHELDIRDGPALADAVAEVTPDVVVHLAAMHFIPAVDGAPEVAWDVNVNGTQMLLDALARHPPELLLFASTAAVYPDRRGPIDESCEPEPPDLYGRTKLAGEHLIADFAAHTGTRCISARIFNVIGRRETNPHVVPEIIDQLRRGRTSLRLGNLEPKRDYTDVVDVAAALHRMTELPPDAPSTLNIGSGRAVSVAQLVQACGELLGRTIDIEIEPDKVRKTDRAELVANSRLLRRTTGWGPTRSLPETLNELLNAANAPSARASAAQGGSGR